MLCFASSGRRRGSRSTSSSPTSRRAVASSSRAILVLLVDRQAQAQAELGVVLEQRVGPGRAAPFVVVQSRAWSAGCRRRSTSSRWRWRRSARSPNSCVISLMYGVSPQPAQAPENSNSGCSSCDVLDRSRDRPARGRSPADLQEEVPVGRFGSRSGGWAAMLIALMLDLALALGRADLDAQRAAGAVFGRDLQRVLAVFGIPSSAPAPT